MPCRRQQASKVDPPTWLRLGWEWGRGDHPGLVPSGTGAPEDGAACLHLYRQEVLSNSKAPSPPSSQLVHLVSPTMAARSYSWKTSRPLGCALACVPRVGQGKEKGVGKVASFQSRYGSWRYLCVCQRVRQEVAGGSENGTTAAFGREGSIIPETYTDHGSLVSVWPRGNQRCSTRFLGRHGSLGRYAPLLRRTGSWWCERE